MNRRSFFKALAGGLVGVMVVICGWKKELGTEYEITLMGSVIFCPLPHAADQQDPEHALVRTNIGWIPITNIKNRQDIRKYGLSNHALHNEQGFAGEELGPKMREWWHEIHRY